jgi:NADH-quinone oxidoreductase subunit N
MNYLELLKLVSPEAVVVVTALIVLAAGLTTQRAVTVCRLVALVGIATASAAVGVLPHRLALLNGMLVISPLNSLFKIICLAVAFLITLLIDAEKSLRNPGEYLAILLLGTLGLLLLVGSEEFLMIFIGLELLGLSLYVMTGFDKSDIRSAEAGLKYFLFGSTASAFTLFGISLIYGMTGTTTLATIAPKLATTATQPLLAAGIIMTLVGFAFKIAVAPFHLWAPDAYQGAPVTSAAFIASASKVASFVVLGKIVLIGLMPLHGSADWHAMVAGWSPVLAVLAALSILLGNFVALAQTNVRRLLAYSAVAHAGYALLGIIAGDRDGFSATLFYITVYALTLIGAFAVVGAVRRQTGGDDLQNFIGFSRHAPLLAACMAVFMLSLAGIPPLAGFFGKFYLFSAAFGSGRHHGLLWLVAVALFGSFVSLYYYLIVLKAIFVDADLESRYSLGAPELSERKSPVTHHFIAQATTAVLAALVLLFGIDPSGLVARIISSLP